jgi:Protein of unknown function (DUF4244)
MSAGSIPSSLLLGAVAPGDRREKETDMRARHDERGITTAEYAVGTAAGAGLAGLLYTLLTGGLGEQLLRTLFQHVLGLLGIG